MSIKREYLNPSGVPDWSGLFSQAAVVEANGIRTVYASGQVGVDEQQVLWGDGSLADQAKRALHNLSVVFKASGAELSDVTKLTVYVVNYTYEDSSSIAAAIQGYFSPGRFPALSLIGVHALGRPEFRIEIEAIAVCSVHE